MPSIAILGSLCSGHGAWPPRKSSSGQALHTINGKPVHCVGDTWAPHTNPSIPETHVGTTITGQALHTINGKAVARVGDSVSCGSVIATGHDLHTIT